ncbi:hypothetical protein E7939_21890 [Salmonella enterica]|nr:hypothetical protein [Salmonella enterica]EAV6370524.1 hypothetical protein [Salmonella enterica]
MVLPNVRFRTARKWSSFSRQRVNKVGNWATTNGDTPATGWASDGTYPATAASNALEASGGGTATVRAVIVMSSGFYNTDLKLWRWRGGVTTQLAGSGAGGSTTTTLTAAAQTVQAGDLYFITANGGFTAGSMSVQAAGTYIEIEPAA